MTLSHKNCIFKNLLSESLKMNTEDLPDQIETSVQSVKLKQNKQKKTRPEDELCARHRTKTGNLWCKTGFFFLNLDITDI